MLKNSPRLVGLFFCYTPKIEYLRVAMHNKSNIRFKEITSDQIVLFPSNIGDKIAPNHPVRIVSHIVDQLNIDELLATYKGGGTSSYHPRMMLKVLFYSYFNNVYSCRRIEQHLKENIHYMWLSGNSTPNFRTINNFRGKRLKGIIHDLFKDLVLMMGEAGVVSLDRQYIDGTKIEAASNRYTFVWRGSIEKLKGKLEDKIALVISEIEKAIDSDNAENKLVVDELESIDIERLNQKIELLNRKKEQLTKEQKKELKKLEEEQVPKLEKYQKDLQIMGERNSYSKTDHDATFMRMKEDKMKNGQLKPGYNIQISTDNQIITNYTLHQRPGDTGTLIPHIEDFYHKYTTYSKEIIADAGYGSEQNYEYLESTESEAYVKYNNFHKEQKRSFKKNLFHPLNLFYNKEEDFLVCPIGQPMHFVGKEKRVSALGYESQVSIYEAVNCKECPMRGLCHKAQWNRKIEINHRALAYRNKAKEKLLSERGLYHRSMRVIEPEPVFGHIKHNHHFKRFTLRGLEKVNIEFGLVAIAHNLRKIASMIRKNGLCTQIMRFLNTFLEDWTNIYAILRAFIMISIFSIKNRPTFLLQEK